MTQHMLRKARACFLRGGQFWAIGTKSSRGSTRLPRAPVLSEADPKRCASRAADARLRWALGSGAIGTGRRLAARGEWHTPARASDKPGRHASTSGGTSAQYNASTSGGTNAQDTKPQAPASLRAVTCAGPSPSRTYWMRSTSHCRLVHCGGGGAYGSCGAAVGEHAQRSLSAHAEVRDAGQVWQVGNGDHPATTWNGGEGIWQAATARLGAAEGMCQLDHAAGSPMSIVGGRAAAVGFGQANRGRVPTGG